MTTLEERYRARHSKALEPAARALEGLIKGSLRDFQRIDRIAVRAKAPGSFLAKAQTARGDGTPKYAEPLEEIQDQIGARVIVFYLPDVERVAEQLGSFFSPIEIQQIVPDSEAEFGYFGKHFVFLLPADVALSLHGEDRNLLPGFFELQVKTLYQHAWAEANHDIFYKSASAFKLSSDQKRKVAFTAAQSWGADKIFEELHQACSAEHS